MEDFTCQGCEEERKKDTMSLELGPRKYCCMTCWYRNDPENFNSEKNNKDREGGGESYEKIRSKRFEDALENPLLHTQSCNFINDKIPQYCCLMNFYTTRLKEFDKSQKVIILDTSARTALEAASSLGCEVGAIIKSLLLKTGSTLLYV